ncbi:MAG: hypothetical protein ACLQHF_16075 [Terracidiphilus sp.]
MGRYDIEWERYRSLRNTAILLFLGALPFIWALQLLRRLALPEELFSALFALYFLFWLVSALRVEFFRCPRCGRFFSMTWWINLSFLARHCIHCGLKKFSEDDDSPGAPTIS